MGGYLSKPNKSDKEILKFCEDMDLREAEPKFCVSELGFYDHCANEFEILIVGADRELVKAVRGLVEKAQKANRKKRK